jgi:hypothetical protein
VALNHLFGQILFKQKYCSVNEAEFGAQQHVENEREN